jgi:regulator of cell morphogenesis and NO signaling
MPLSPEKTVGEIAAASPAAARVLEKHHIDYYSGRGNPFREACRVAGVSAEEILEEVRRSTGDAWTIDDNWNTAPIEHLIQYLMDTHQRWLQQDLPWIDHLLDRAASVGGENQSIPPLRRVFFRLRADLEQHLRNEENVLFPAILEIERAMVEGRPAPRLPFGSVRNPIHMIEQDHEIDTQLWDELRELAYGYVAGEDAPQSIRLLYSELGQLETAVHEHTHLENNVLFPRVMRLVQHDVQHESSLHRAHRA